MDDKIRRGDIGTGTDKKAGFRMDDKIENAQADEKEQVSHVKYGVFMEKVNTKLRRIMLTNPFAQKDELVELLKSTMAIEKNIGDDKELDGTIKRDLVTRLDTFAWFMTSLIDEIGDLEKAAKNIEKEVGSHEEVLDYFG